MRQIYRFLKDQSGVTGIEYALIAGGIGIAIAMVVVHVGSTLQGIFTTVNSGFDTG